MADDIELTLAEAARITGVSIRRLRKLGRLAAMPEAEFEARLEVLEEYQRPSRERDIDRLLTVSTTYDGGILRRQ
jgi:hypothetical protein